MTLDDEKTSTALRYKCTYFQVHTCNLIAFLLLIDIFGEAMGLKRVNNDPVLVLNAKGGEIKAKANGSATTCLKNNRVRIFDLSKMILLQNLVSCGGEF
jgi:hypothetical protein